MVLDIALFRAAKGGDPDVVRESQRRRFASVEVVDEIIALDESWRAAEGDISAVRGQLNALQKEIGKRKKAKEEIDDLLVKKKEFEVQIAEITAKREETYGEIQKKLKTIGNLVHESVPVFEEEDNNQVVRTHGEVVKWTDEERKTKHPHDQLLWMIGGYDPDRGSNVGGARCYFLTGVAVQLNLAIVQYGLAFLGKRGYSPVQPPYFMRQEVMAETAQLEQFDEELYKVTGDSAGDKYLIATSEQPISAFHRGEWIEPKDLPYKYAGFSTNFRKEAGSGGRDVAGIFRVHQFEKVEQFCVTKPEDSWEEFDRMILAAEEFNQSLGLPYQVVAIVSGKLNNAAAKKLDLEAYLPSSDSFRELVSCSNCTDYQSRALNVRMNTGKSSKKGAKKEKAYVHMLNSTLVATTRTMCAILEHYQTPEGVTVPEVLRPYLGGLEFMPFVRGVKPPTAGAKGKK